MDKRYQVFVSSTFEDLQEERKEVMQALLELDCIPAGMELFPASNDDQWTLIKRVIDDCDYYLLIIGGRYGSTNDDGISYTQMEFEYALKTGKPIISFLPKHPDNIPMGKCDNDPDKKQKLEKFKELAKKKLVKFWDGPENLGSVVSRSMVKLIKEFPADGWVKSGNVVDEKSVHEISKLQRENEELKKRLERMATEAPKGTEGLSQGEDPIRVAFSFKGFKGKAAQRFSFKNFVDCTWNDLFIAIAPYMIDECTERKLRLALSVFVEGSSEDVIAERTNEGFHGFDSFEIDLDSYNIIKIQFKALGLICLSEKKRAVSDKQSYWKLTPYGDYVMTQLLAIVRE